MGYYDDDYVKELQDEIRDLKELVEILEENNESLRHHVDMLRNGFVDSEDSEPEDQQDDGYYRDEDYEPGSIMVNYKHGEKKAELITPTYKEKFDGFTFKLTPRKGLEIGIKTKKVPRN